MPQKGMIEILDKDTNSAVEDVDFLDDFEDQSETEPAGLNMLLNKLMTDQEEEDDGLSEDDILEDIDDLLDEEDDSEDESVDESEEEVNLLGEEEETYLGDEDLDDFESLDELEEEKVERDAKKDTTMLFIPADKIHPNKMNDFSVEDDLTPLKTSIEYFGLRQPLDVLPEEDGSYRLVGGERRYRAICQSIEEGSRQFVDGIPLCS